ncbi:MAG: clostripain-related cysteine peptidase [Hydrogenoanaerobacterium sp.]
MKKICSILLAFVIILMSASGCGDKPTPESAPELFSEQSAPQVSSEQVVVPSVQSQIVHSKPEGEKWTVLVYICGTDLESSSELASMNIEEMVAATQSEKIDVVFQTGGAKKWAFDEINPKKLERWKVSHGKFELVDSKPLASMGRASTLGDFLKWGVSAYPADKYMCVVWDHGGGSVSGVAADELFEWDSLDLRELAEGVSMAGVQFEAVGFDACLMSTIETAAALTPYARYMVASQELEPGTGWDYNKWLSYLASKPTANGLELGKVICDSFYEKCKFDEMESLVTLSVTDLSKIPALVQSFDKMAEEMKSFTASTNKLQPLTQAIFKAENYGGNNDNEGYTNMVDLGDLAICAKGVLSKTGEVLLDNLFAAIPYKIGGEGRQKSNGLSVYVPLGVDDEELDSYANAAAISGEYLRFLEGLYDWKAPPDVTINQPIFPPAQNEVQELPVNEQIALSGVSIAQALRRDDYTLKYSLGISDDGYVVLSVDQGEDIISTVAFDLFYHDVETNAIWYLGSDYDVNMSDDGKKYWDNFRNVWTIIGGKLCMMQALSFTDDYILYTVPVRVNGMVTNLRMIYHIGTDKFEVIGTWNGIDGETGMSSRDVKKLKDGDVVTFTFVAADLKTGKEYEFDGESFTVKGPVIAEEATLFDGDYYYQYAITDIFGKTYESNMAVITSKGGEITVDLVK